MHIPPKAAAVGIYMSSTFNLGCREAEQARPEFPKTKHPLVRWYYSNEYRENLVKLEEHVTPDWLEVATKTLLGDLRGRPSQGAGLPVDRFTSRSGGLKATPESGNLPTFHSSPEQSEQFLQLPLILSPETTNSQLLRVFWWFQGPWPNGTPQTFKSFNQSVAAFPAGQQHLWRPWSYLSAVSPHLEEMNRTPENCDGETSEGETKKLRPL